MLRSIRLVRDPASFQFQRSFCSPQSRPSPKYLNSTTSRLGSRSYQQGHRAESSTWAGDQTKLKKIFIWTCIGVNTGVFLCWFYARNPPKDAGTTVRRDRFELFRTMNKKFLLTRENIKEGRYYTIITSAFSHIEGGHLLFNMIAFHQFGQALVYTPGLGVSKLATLALGSAAAGGLTWLVRENTASKNSQAKRAALGFSGAVMGVMSAAACLHPFMRYAFFGIVPVPLWALGIGYVVYDTYYLGSGSRTAHDAHIGGAVFGGLYYALVLRRFGGVLGSKRFGR